MNVEAFDSVAENYDAEFTETALGVELRQIVWRRLEEAFKPGSHVLELNCGTGEDAIWLARRGVRVLATDVAPAMLERARQKAAAEGLSGGIEFKRLDLADPTPAWPECQFDGALSNFGGLNCVRDLRSVSRFLSRSIRAGGLFVAIVMGRSCAWEILWHMLRVEPRRAFRRFSSDGVDATVGGARVRVWYPSLAHLRTSFAPDFVPKGIRGLGVFLPPSYLRDAVQSRFRLMRSLIRLETMAGSARPLRHLADHVLIEFERTQSALGARG